MKKQNYGLALAAREHLAAGKPLTRLEALIFFGLSDLTKLVSVMRREGWVIKSKKVLLAAAVKRVNEVAVLTPPPNLPIREILMMEYWVSK